MKKKKSKLSFIEKFGIISSFVFSLISLIFSIGEFVYENIIEKAEKISIIDEYESDYFFDGNVLSKSISIVISNKSNSNVSLIEIDIEREGKHYFFDSVENSICPINMKSNETITKVVQIEFDIEEETKQFILNKYGRNCNIDTYELDTYLEYNEDIHNNNKIIIRPSIKINIKTANDFIIKFERNGGASA